MIKALRLYLSLSICCCFVACHDNSADDAIDPVVEGRVPIVLSMSGPQFGVSVDKQAPGRRNAPSGRGTLEGWGEDGELWKNANFHVFAYQTQNEVNGLPNGLCDMNQTTSDIQNSSSLSSSGSVLLYDRIMRVQSESGDAQLYENLYATAPKTFYYPTGDQRARYKFYAYYADNLEAQNIQRNTSTVTGDITIDGSQDVMHAFAYHTFDDFWNIITDLKDNQGVTDNELRLLCNPDDREASRPIYNNYLYSTVAAHRGFQPRFHLNRLMTRVNVYVAGGGVYGDNGGLDDYKNLVVTGLSIRNAKTKGTITIANDNWTETTYQADSANIIKWSDDATESLRDLNFPLESRIPFFNIIGNDTVENESFYDASIYPQVASFPELLRNHINIQSTTPVRLAEPLLLAPSESYTIHLDMLYANRSTTNEDELNKDNPYLRYTFESSVRLKGADGEALSFQQGQQYNIFIYVFGPQEIGIKVEIDKPWYEGGTIRVDEEQGYDYDPNETDPTKTKQEIK